MSEERARLYPIRDRWSYLWLVIGAALTLFSSGRWPIPLAVWLASVFMIRFMRTQKVLRGFILAWLAAYVAAVIGWWGMMPGALPVPGSLVMLAINMLLIGALPLLADRLLAPRLKGFAATLVFPLAVTALESVSMAANPVGSFGAQAYSLYGNLGLMQLLSVTGMWGLACLMNWLAPVVNWAWERSFSWYRIWRGMAIFATVNLLVLVYGSARLLFSPPPAGTVRVASLTAAQFQEGGPIDLKTDREGFRRRTSDLWDHYFEQTIREARAGAQIGLWPEGAGLALEEDEAMLIAQGQEVAVQEGIYLAMPLYTIYDDPNRLPENRLIVVDPAGDVVLDHLKYGAGLLEGIRPGERVLRTFESPFGTISGVICWDADFPATIRQAGRNGTDILLVPSNDFREIDPLHTQMAVYRAIENGVSMVRQASNGLSMATDAYGRPLAAMDHFVASERVMVAQVPTRGVSTIYSVIGDLFGWLAVAGFVGVVLWVVVAAIRRRRATRAQSSQADGKVAS